MFDGIYYLITCRAIEVFPPRATLFAPPPPSLPRQSTSISTREKIMTCDSENSVDDILRTNVETTQQTQNICITFIQRRPNVFDVGPTLYKCYTNVCVSWVHGFLPHKHDALTQCWYYVGPPSATLAQRKTSIGSMRGVCWVVICKV